MCRSTGPTCSSCSVELLVKFLYCLYVVIMEFFLALVGCFTGIPYLIVVEVSKCLVVNERGLAMQASLAFVAHWSYHSAIDDDN